MVMADAPGAQLLRLRRRPEDGIDPASANSSTGRRDGSATQRMSLRRIEADMGRDDRDEEMVARPQGRYSDTLALEIANRADPFVPEQFETTDMHAGDDGDGTAAVDHGNPLRREMQAEIGSAVGDRRLIAALDAASTNRTSLKPSSCSSPSATNWGAWQIVGVRIRRTVAVSSGPSAAATSGAPVTLAAPANDRPVKNRRRVGDLGIEYLLKRRSAPSAVLLRLRLNPRSFARPPQMPPGQWPLRRGVVRHGRRGGQAGCRANVRAALPRRGRRRRWQ